MGVESIVVLAIILGILGGLIYFVGLIYSIFVSIVPHVLRAAIDMVVYLRGGKVCTHSDPAQYVSDPYDSRSVYCGTCTTLIQRPK